VAAAAGTLAEQRAKVEGHEQFAVRGVPAGAFSVLTAGDGFELHLEVDGAVRAWALRKAPSTEPRSDAWRSSCRPAGGGRRRLGRRHLRAGRARAWPEALDRGHAVFVLHGDELEGGFALQRTRGTGRARSGCSSSARRRRAPDRAWGSPECRGVRSSAPCRT
jgi:hypothetical protein